MGSIFGILNTGRQALHVQQSGLQTIGNNIANAGTEGYSRQRTVIESLSYGGVTLAGIERIRDGFITARLLSSNSNLGYSSTASTALQQLETAVDETDDSGLTVALQNFFNALQDLSASPDGATEREAFTSQARQLLASFSNVSEQIGELRGQLDEQVQQQVDRVNTITAEIARINQKLGTQDVSIETPQNNGLNELLDQRDQLMSELSSIIPVRTTSANGTMTVFCGSIPLVDGAFCQTFQLQPDAGNQGYSNVVMADLGGSLRDVSPDLSTGSLGALISTRDGQARDMLDQVDRLAATLTRDMNAVHRAGYGLDGVTGRDLFTGLTASATMGVGNKGTVTNVTAQILDQSALTFDNYEVRFTSATSYDVIDTTSGAAVSAGNSWTSGQSIDIAGMRLSFDSGAPAAGDVFDMNAFSGMSSRIDLTAAVKNDSRAVAAGATSAAGDNENALAMIALASELTMGNPPSQTYEAYYNSMRTRLATQVNMAVTSQTQDETTQTQLTSLQESVSGVSLDEEATNIIQFQRAFEAASRVISVTDEMLQTIMNMI